MMQKRNISGIFILTVLLFFGGNHLQANPQEPSLRDKESVMAIVKDLKTYIPRRMKKNRVSGLAIALIHNGSIAWSAGFGVTNRLTPNLVTPHTIFEVASNGKAVAAYLALRLVQQGKLELDKPLSNYLQKPWLNSPHGSLITLRHVLTHTSGLTNQMIPLNKQVYFAPGTKFFYSGIGFMYLQHVIEKITGNPIEVTAKKLVFTPLSMTSSSYSVPLAKEREAAGHISHSTALQMFGAMFVVMLILSAIVCLAILRWKSGSWRPGKGMVFGVMLCSAIFSLGLFGLLDWHFMLFLTLCVIPVALILAIGILVVKKLVPKYQGAGLTFLCAAVLIGGIVPISTRLELPVLIAYAKKANIAYTLKSTVGDLSRFLLEVNTPRHLDNKWARYLKTPQVKANLQNSWAAGLGVQHSAQGKSLWHSGSNFGYRSLMVIYPEKCFGIVILTNSENGLGVACDIAQFALGGNNFWSYKRNND